MSCACDKHRALLIPYTLAELPPLQAEHLRAHLHNCAACTALHEQLAASLTAAQHWQPQVSEAHLEQLSGRLRPYMQQRASTSSWRLSLAAFGVAAAALVAVLGGLWWAHGNAARSTSLRVPIAATPAHPLAQAKTSGPALQRHAPSPYLRFISGAGWDGHVDGDFASASHRMAVTMTHGFAVFSFVGGHGRRLRVATPEALVEVVGTRFYVHASAGRTQVGVGEGKVRVLTLSGTRLLRTGEVAAFDSSGASLAPEPDAAAASHLGDDYLMAIRGHADEAKAARLHRGHGQHGQKLAAGSGQPDVLAQLERAEDLAQAGKVDAALAIYRACASDPRPAFAPLRDLSRYEMARLIGFRRGDVSRARTLLAQLTRSTDREVRRQSQLALCELDRGAHPCAAATCLTAIEHRGNDAELGREAAQLLQRWQLAGRHCKGVGEEP